jgi:hypothetical protein
LAFDVVRKASEVYGARFDEGSTLILRRPDEIPNANGPLIFSSSIGQFGEFSLTVGERRVILRGSTPQFRIQNTGWIVDQQIGESRVWLPSVSDRDSGRIELDAMEDDNAIIRNLERHSQEHEQDGENA